MTEPENQDFEYFRDILNALKAKGSCNRLKVSSVIVKDGYIISTGYNGSPRGCKHCGDSHLMEGHHCVNTIHGELNAIINAAKLGISIEGANMICTNKPCFRCMQALINSGIKRVYYFDDYNDNYQNIFETNKYCEFIRIK